MYHTYNSRFSEVKINGQAYGETGLCALWAGHFGVPVVMVAGDEATCREATALLGDVETAAVKRGLMRDGATLVPVKKARQIIRDGAARALANLSRFHPFTVEKPVVLVLELMHILMADLVGGFIKAVAF